jgi:hypothetical protein
VGRFAIVFFRPVADLEFAAEAGGLEGADLGDAPGPAAPLVVAEFFEVGRVAFSLTAPLFVEGLFLDAVEALFLDGDTGDAVALELAVFGGSVTGACAIRLVTRRKQAPAPYKNCCISLNAGQDPARSGLTLSVYLKAAWKPAACGLRILICRDQVASQVSRLGAALVASDGVPCCFGIRFSV